MIAWLAGALLAAQAPAELAGMYQTQQIEVGAMLELNPDGTFRYMLDYGAVSEAAGGHWNAANGVVHLDGDPLPVDLMAQIGRSDAGLADERLVIDGDTLVMRRHDTLLTFYRDEQ